MIRFILRFIGVWILAGAFVAGVYDGARSIAADKLLVTTLRQTWEAVHAASLNQFQAGLTRRGGTAAATVAAKVIDAPTWLVFGAIGAVLVVLGRRPRRLIGYTRD